MTDLHYIDDASQAAALLQPIRLDVMKRLGSPRTCPDLARELGLTTQQVNYHMNVLKEAGLVDRIDERRVRGTVEGIYQAKARSYWLSPRLVGRLGGPREGADRARNELSLGYLLSLAEDLQEDVARLARRTKPAAALGLSMHLDLADETRRSEFLEDVQGLFKTLARKYGSTDSPTSPGADAGPSGRSSGSPSSSSTSFRLMLACYLDPRTRKVRPS